MNIVPLFDNLIVRPTVREEKSKGGIIIPDTVGKEKPEQGEVIAVGVGKLDNNGRRQPIDVVVGDIIIFKRYSPDEFDINGEKLLFLNASDVMAIIK